MAVNGQTGSPHTPAWVLILFIFDPSPSVVSVSPYYLLPRKLPAVSKRIIFPAFHCFGGHGSNDCFSLLLLRLLHCSLIIAIFCDT